MSNNNSNPRNWIWLSDEYGKKLEAIRNGAIRIWRQNETHNPQLPGYTPHGETHSRSVEDLIHRLIPNKRYRRLTQKERFYLLASAWIHDLGMIKGIAGQNDINSPAETIRDIHHERAEKFIVNNFSHVDIEQKDAQALGIIAYSHGVTIGNCPEKFTVGNEVVSLQLLAAYLRLADLLDISESRSPSTNYAICLSYNIPLYTKLHWIKSRLISGIELDSSKRCIILEFKVPHESYYAEFEKSKSDKIKTNLARLRQNVIDDISKELDTVKTILIKGGVSSFLTVESRETNMAIDDQVLPELFRLANYYEMISHPSATKLMLIVLQTIQDIANPPFSKQSNSDPQIVLKEIADFINETSDEIKKNRPCHVGLAKMIRELEGLAKSESVEKLSITVERLISDNIDERKAVRRSAAKYFIERHSFFRDPDCLISFADSSSERHSFVERPIVCEDKRCQKKSFNIILYGYSELVIKALCGFRDVVINKILHDIVKNIKYYEICLHKNNIESIASSMFRIFVCEGQPKTITARNDALRYHDGTRYALELTRRGFSNVIVIPDLVSGSLLFNLHNNKETTIDYVLLGMNGLSYREDPDKCPDKSYFLHSSGHAAIAALTKHCLACPNSKTKKPRLVLVLSRSKCETGTGITDTIIESSGTDVETNDKDVIFEGYRFWRSYDTEPTRQQPFLARDEKLRKELFDAGVLFYNPREDIISLNTVDDIIGDGEFFQGIGQKNAKSRSMHDFSAWIKPQKDENTFQ
jgi:hypothetical protein